MTPSPAAPTFSLWFMPTGAVYDRLSKVIHELSYRYGAPEFLPHVTLLGSFTGRRGDLISQCSQVAAGIRPFRIRLEEIGFRDEYFRCLFIHAALTEPLRAAHRAACRAFGRQREPAFMPHLSLLYGYFPRSRKGDIIAEMGPRLAGEFKVRSLYLYQTQGNPLRWRKVARFGLH